MKKIKNILKRFIEFIKSALHPLKGPHYAVLILIVGLGIFNGVTSLSPYLKQHSREKNIEKTFNQWWKDAGEEQFRSVGLEPTAKIKNEEFLRYREKYLSQNAALIPEERIEELKSEYKSWWNETGRDQFFLEYNKYPSDIDYQKRENKYVEKYTNQLLRYSMAFVPQRENFEKIATSWMLAPSFFSYLIFAGFFFFAFYHLERRWKGVLFLGITVLLVLAGGIAVYLLASTSFFDHYAQQRYMGMSIAVCFLLGAAAFGPKRLEISQAIKGVAIAGVILDMIVNWFMNEGIYGAVTLCSPLFFALGSIAGVKIETRRKTKAELDREKLEERIRNNANRNPMAERKAKTRAAIEEGFSAAKNGLMDNAQRILGQALNGLLQEHPVDKALVKSVTQRLTSANCYVDFSSNQWLEWGEIAKAKNAPEAAIMMLKKGLSLEQDRNFARRALYILGEICVNNNIEREDGIKRLKKVIEMNENDMMAKQAKRMLESQKPEEAAPKEDEQQ